MATCAYCLQPFAGGERKVVGGTEVFHDRCVTFIGQSLTFRLRRKIVELEARARNAEARASEGAANRASVDAANADARRLRADNDRLAKELRELRTSATTVASSGAYFRDRYDAQNLRIEEMQREMENLRRELALRQTLDGERVDPGRAQPSGPATPPPDPQNNKDDTEVRFSLLELDIPK